MTIPSTVNRLAKATLAMAAFCFAMTLASGSAGAATFSPGLVQVDGYGWSFSSQPVDVQLETDGQTVYSVADILGEADGQTNQFSLATVPGIEIVRPGLPVRKVTCTGNEVRAGNDACPTFVSSTDKTTMVLQNGSRVDYTDTSPTIFITEQKDMKVVISPRSKQIKSGDSVTFTASVTGANGSVTYDWSFGDGKSATTSKDSVSHTFTGSDKTFNVVVEVSSPKNTRGDDDVAVITTGKIKKQEKPKDNNNTNNGNGGGGGSNNSTPYVPGYTDYGYGGSTGTGTPSTGSPSSGNPQQEKQKKQQQNQPSDNGLQTVSGELIDPGSTATVLPSTDSTKPGTQEANPADGSGGGGIPDGAKAAIGIGALLGLGGLAEAGGFAGAFRRFGFRP